MNRLPSSQQVPKRKTYLKLAPIHTNDPVGKSTLEQMTIEETNSNCSPTNMLSISNFQNKT